MVYAAFTTPVGRKEKLSSDSAGGLQHSPQCRRRHYSMSLRKSVGLALIAVVALAAAPSAFARSHTSVSIGFSGPGYSVGYTDCHHCGWGGRSYGHVGFYGGGYYAPAYYAPAYYPDYYDTVVYERPVYRTYYRGGGYYHDGYRHHDYGHHDYRGDHHRGHGDHYYGH